MQKQLSDHNRKIEEVLTRLDDKDSMPIEGFFFDGQIFNANALICNLIRGAGKRIVMVDDYIDDSVFRQLDKRTAGVSATVYTPSISRTLRQDLERHNAQYAHLF